MITLIKPILLKFAGTTAVKKLLIDLLTALAKQTDNDVDDSFVRHLAVLLKVCQGGRCNSSPLHWHWPLRG